MFDVALIGCFSQVASMHSSRTSIGRIVSPLVSLPNGPRLTFRSSQILLEALVHMGGNNVGTGAFTAWGGTDSELAFLHFVLVLRERFFGAAKIIADDYADDTGVDTGGL